MRAEWKPIPRDKDGFFDENSDLFEQLPIVIAYMDEDYPLTIEYIDESNWIESQSDLNKPSYKYYACVEIIELS